MNDVVGPVMDVRTRGITLRFATGNPRLRVWAERFEEVEPELLDLIDVIPSGSIFYDAGASIGLFALYAAVKKNARVVAIEPEAQNFGTLEMNHYLNRASLRAPFTALNLALSDTVGIGQMYARVYGAGEHVKILDASETRDTRESFDAQHVQSVLKMPLDFLLDTFQLEPPEILKIDVDGAEVSLLRGASNTLDAPALHTVFIEIADSPNRIEQRMLERHGFHLAHRFPVVRLRGGHYEGLFNCVFLR